jgi:ParB/RepB/Spo0J family partition protein
MRISQLHPDQVNFSPDNVRRFFREGSLKELADSISEYGLLENLVVKPDVMARDEYILVAGERRYRAIRMLIEEGRRPAEMPVACLIIDSDGTFENIIENLSREDIAPWELGLRFSELAEAGYPQKEIGARVGKNQAYVSRYINIARGLHPASIALLCKIRTTLTVTDLMRISSLLDVDKNPDEKAQADLIGVLSGTKMHRKKRRAERTDTEKLTRRLTYLREEMRVPSHARPFVDVIVSYLSGKTNKCIFPEEL